MEKLKEIIAYFFGQGQEIEFKNFTLAHFLPIIIMAIIIYFIYRYREQLKNYKYEKNIRMVMAFMLIICEMSYYWRLIGVPSLNPNPHEHLPITVCGWAIICGSYLLVTKSQSMFDITYFFVFSGTIFALATPTVISYCGPTRFRYYQFWLEHTLGFITIFYMMFVHGMRPNFKSMIKAFVALAIMGGIAIMANSMLPGANYLYVARPESTSSILDFLPKNYVVRLILMAIIICVMFFLCYLPWFIKDLKAKKQNVATKNNTQLENENLEQLSLFEESTNKLNNDIVETLTEDQPQEEQKQ